MPKYPSGTAAADQARQAAHDRRMRRNEKRRHQRDSIAHGRRPLGTKERLWRKMPVLRFEQFSWYQSAPPLPRHRRRGSRR